MGENTASEARKRGLADVNVQRSRRAQNTVVRLGGDTVVDDLSVDAVEHLLLPARADHPVPQEWSYCVEALRA